MFSSGQLANANSNHGKETRTCRCRYSPIGQYLELEPKWTLPAQFRKPHLQEINLLSSKRRQRVAGWAQNTSRGHRSVWQVSESHGVDPLSLDRIHGKPTHHSWHILQDVQITSCTNKLQTLVNGRTCCDSSHVTELRVTQNKIITVE